REHDDGAEPAEGEDEFAQTRAARIEPRTPIAHAPAQHSQGQAQRRCTIMRARRPHRAHAGMRRPRVRSIRVRGRGVALAHSRVEARLQLSDGLEIRIRFSIPHAPTWCPRDRRAPDEMTRARAAAFAHSKANLRGVPLPRKSGLTSRPDSVFPRTLEPAN